MRTTIQTPDGPRQIPDWANCYCVSDHRPNFIHPYPFALPNGDELWLCPNTLHQAKTLLNLYVQLDGPPNGITAAKFNYFVRQLITLYWQQVMEFREDEAEFEQWKAEREPEPYTGMSDAEIFDFIKKVEAHA